MAKRTAPQTRENVISLVDAAIFEATGIEPEGRLSDNAKLMIDLDCDSLDMIELIMSIERQFDITISDEDAAKIHTVGHLREYVVSRVL